MLLLMSGATLASPKRPDPHAPLYLPVGRSSFPMRILPASLSLRSLLSLALAGCQDGSASEGEGGGSTTDPGDTSADTGPVELEPCALAWEWSRAPEGGEI